MQQRLLCASRHKCGIRVNYMQLRELKHCSSLFASIEAHVHLEELTYPGCRLTWQCVFGA